MTDHAFQDPNKYIYPAVVRRESLSDGRPWYVAYHPDLPGCLGDGPTEQAAKADLESARHDYLASMIEDGLDIPAPAVDVLAAATTSTWSANASRTIINFTTVRSLLNGETPDSEAPTLSGVVASVGCH